MRCESLIFLMKNHQDGRFDGGPGSDGSSDGRVQQDGSSTDALQRRNTSLAEVKAYNISLIYFTLGWAVFVMLSCTKLYSS